MARTLYNLLLCATLALLATLWLRPGIAQDLIDLARSVRAQSPGVAAAAPQANDWNTPPGWSGQPGSVPYSNLPGAPTQPMPATRPASWPGAPLEYSSAPNSTNNVAAAINAVPVNTAPNAATSNTVAPQTAFLMSTAAGPASAQPLPPSIVPVPTPMISPTAAAGPPMGVPGDTATYPYANPAPLGQMPPASAEATSQLPNPPAAPPASQAPISPAEAAQQNSAAAAPESNANMQSLQVLPGPRQDYEDGKIVATVGTLPILAGDVRAMINQAIHNKMISAPPPGQEKELYEAAMRPVLKQMAEMKLVVNDAKQTIPAQALGKIENEVNRDFDKNQIPKLMESYHAANQHELDEALRAAGSSLDWERRSFFEQNMFHGWLQQQIKDDQQISLADVLGYYEQHLPDYEYPAQARWEELMVSFDQFPDKTAAYAAIAQLGNQVMQGAPLAEVAKRSSQGPTADQGGAYDWTTQGSLACKALDENLFKLPIGSLSTIIESDRGFHIIRVVERKDAGRKSFEDTQGDIKKQLKDENRKKQLDKYLSDLRKKTPIHSVFDDQPGGLDGPPKVVEHNF